MDQNGILNWDIPKGEWTIMRFGYSLTGAKNRPAVPSGLGYEVDKLSREHTEAYLHGYTDPIAAALGSLYGKGLRYVLLDSWEAGMQNWTDKMIPEFMKRRGYDPTPFLPALAGRIVGNSDISDRFLWDFRRTLADMFAAESFTGGGFESPWSLKKIGDYWFAQGVNRIIFHTSAHQPLDTKPGNTMVGTHINRNITWAEQAKPFMTYLARNSYMLQQGQFVADITYLLDEGAPSTMPIWGNGLNPAPPEGHDYDYINADVLINRMSVDSNGRLALPDSMSYAMLVLPNTEQMTIPVLMKLHELVKNGATVVGRKPLRTPGLSGYPASEVKLKMLTDDLWDDLEFSRPLDAEISWIHRRSGETDIYFIVNRTDKELKTDVRFRVSGKEAEIWHPESGRTEPSSYVFDRDKTIVPLQLTERQSVLVVFRTKSNAVSRTIAPVSLTQLSAVEGPWEITFPSGLGAPEKAMIMKLESWTKNDNQGIKYFSGSATYATSINAPANWFQRNAKILLDLGKVGDIAEVIVNGAPTDTLWMFPYRSDITMLLKKGNNKLEIKVTNQWTNRLLGDRAAVSGQKVLNSNLFVPARQLNESGLLGPVKILCSNIPDNKD